jgi:hypothetical protein
MHMNTLVIAALASMLVAYTAWVTVLVCRSPDLDRNQKILQSALAWLVPILGAAFVHLVNRAQIQRFSRPWIAGAEPQIDQGVSPRDFTHPSHD